MKKLKVSKNLTYKITINWSTDYVLSECIRERIIDLINECRSFKRAGVKYDFALNDIKVLRGVLRQIDLHSDL